MSRDELHSEIHPEELIAKAATRALTEGEAADLDAHLRRCPACALHVNLRGEIARAMAPTESDHEIAARAVQRLLDASGTPPVAQAARRRSAPAVARVAIVVAVVLATSVAAAGFVWRARVRSAEAPAAAPARSTSAKATRAMGPRPGAVDVPAEPVAPAPVAEIAPAAEAAPVAEIAPAVEAAPTTPAALALALAAAPTAPAVDRRAAALDAGRGGGAVAGRAFAAPVEPPVAEAPAIEARAAAAPPAPVVDETAREAAPAAPTETAGALFETAERAKRAGDAKEAERAFARLATAFAGSREEIAARPLRGQILLDDLGRPEDALASFQRYLRDRPTGVLAEEARAGRAEALRQLGRTTEEADAWRDLMAHHPRSVYAARARDRLSKLTGARE
jgi:TolA-binding protein